MQEGKRKSPTLQGIGSDLNKKLNAKIRKKTYRKSSSVKELEGLAQETTRKKFSEIPQECLTTRKYRDDIVNELARCIIDFFRFKGCQAERINNSGRFTAIQKTFTDIIGRKRTIIQKKRIKGTGTTKLADISEFIAGQSIKIKAKNANVRLSHAQIAFQQSINLSGNNYLIVDSLEFFFYWYNNLKRDGYGK